MDSKITDIYMQMLMENSPKEEKAVEYTIDKIKELLDRMDLDQADLSQMKKLYDRVQTFAGYRPIKDTLTKKGYNPKVLKKYSGEIQALIEDLPEQDKQDFFEFLKSGSTAKFPVEQQQGNIYTILTDVPGVSQGIAQQIMSHTGQDEAKRGVGMGELALALLFSNIEAAGGLKSKEISAAKEEKGDYVASTMNKRSRNYDEEKHEAYKKGKLRLSDAKKMAVKGDLELNGKEFEIKGENAALGARSDAAFSGHATKAVKYLTEKLGITINGNNYEIDNAETVEGLSQFPTAIATAYKQSQANNDGDNFKIAFKGYLKNFGGYEKDGNPDELLNSRIYNSIDLSNPRSIQRGIAILNLFRYIQKEGFYYFMAHDIGTSDPGTGEYVFASGDPEKIASEIYNNKKVKFEKVSYNGLRPRIGFGAKMVEDNEIVEKIYA